MARRRSGAARKHGTRAKPMLRKGTKTLPSKSRKGHAKARKHYVANRAKILRRAKQYYRKHRGRILQKAKIYRKKLRSGRAPLYKHGGVGGRFPRYKRLKRVNKYTRVGKRRSGGRRRKG